MWEFAKRQLSLVADLLQVAGFFGISPATICSLAVVLIGSLGNFSFFYLGLVAVLVFVFVFCLTWRFGSVSLSLGARQAYEKLRGTVWAEAAERLRIDSSPNGILDYVATAISLHAPIYGEYLPSTRLEKIPDRHTKSGSIKEGATVLQLNDQHKREVVGLRVKRSHLRGAIKHMSEGAKAFHANRN
jgi:hypothetical protein